MSTNISPDLWCPVQRCIIGFRSGESALPTLFLQGPADNHGAGFSPSYSHLHHIIIAFLTGQDDVQVVNVNNTVTIMCLLNLFWAMYYNDHIKLVIFNTFLIVWCVCNDYFLTVAMYVTECYSDRIAVFFFPLQVTNNQIAYSNMLKYDIPKFQDPIRRAVPLTMPVACYFNR